MGESNYGKDDLGILKYCHTKKSRDEMLDQWDEYYGEYPLDYEVYVLLDMTKPGRYIFGPLKFDHEPFYIGSGLKGRGRKSINDRPFDILTFKHKRLEKIALKSGRVRVKIIGRFYTKTKAEMVEKKLMNLIPRSYLTNSVFHLCEVPLTEDDCNIINYKKY